MSIAFGGALGSLVRYYLSNSTLKNIIFLDLPLAILIINILGSFTFGFVMRILETNVYITNNLKVFLTFGFLSAFTTFSAFAWESVVLIQNEMYIKLVIYCLASIILSIAFCLLGYYLGR